MAFGMSESDGNHSPREPKIACLNPNYRPMYCQQHLLSGTRGPRTVRSDVREPTDSYTANMALKPSCQGYLTDEQNASRDFVKRQLHG